MWHIFSYFWTSNIKIEKMRRHLFLNWAKQNQKFLFLLLFALLLSGSIIAQKAWTLRECIEHALENNIEIKKSEINAKSNKVTETQRKLDLIPDLNANTSYSFGWGRAIDSKTNSYVNNNTQQASFGVSSSLTIFSGFQKFNTIKQAHFDYLASKYESDRIRDDVSLRIAASYLNVLYSMELVEKSEAQLEVTKIQIHNTEKMVKAGTLPKGNLLEIQSQKAQEEVNLINAQNQLTLAYLDLKQLLELEAGKDFEIEKPQVDVSMVGKILPSQDVYNTAVNRLPQIKSAEYTLMSAKKGVSIAKGGWSPRISLNGGWGTSYSDQDAIYQIDEITGDYVRDEEGKPIKIGTVAFKDQFEKNKSEYLQAAMNIPIFNGWSTNSNISRSKLAAINAEHNLQLTKNTVRKNIEQAYSDAIAAYKTYNANLKSVASFQESFKYMEKKFNVGMENSLNYNTAKAQLTRAESDLISAKYDYIFKTKILDFYMGIPLTLENK